MSSARLSGQWAPGIPLPHLSITEIFKMHCHTWCTRQVFYTLIHLPNRTFSFLIAELYSLESKQSVWSVLSSHARYIHAAEICLNWTPNTYPNLTNGKAAPWSLEVMSVSLISLWFLFPVACRRSLFWTMPELSTCWACAAPRPLPCSYCRQFQSSEAFTPQVSPLWPSVAGSGWGGGGGDQMHHFPCQSQRTEASKMAGLKKALSL